jgi:hypothetical protein
LPIAATRLARIGFRVPGHHPRLTDPARFGGGDSGSITASRLGYAHPDKLIGIHLNRIAVRREAEQFADPAPEERQYLDELAVWLREETGYQ